MKKILIIGASILQLPAIKKAKEIGFYVGVADYNPQAIGISFADEYFNVSTIDIEGVVDVARRFKPDGIMTLATDMPMRAIAKATEACGLPGISYEASIKATDKGEMVKAFDLYGVEHPWFCIAENRAAFNSIKDSIKYPCIMKPTDNAGSRGVVLCNNKKQLLNGYEYSFRESRSGNIIIEEYLEGPEFSVEVLVINGIPNVLQITDKLTTGAPHFVEMGHSQPSKQPKDVQQKIRDLACRAVEAVGITSGPAHVEMILTDRGPVMVELGARMGGDNITTHLVPLSTGIDMVKATIECAIGVIPNIEPTINKGSAIRYIETSPGYLRKILGVDRAKQIPGIEEIAIVKKEGEWLDEIGSSVDRLGFVIAQNDSPELAVKSCDDAIKMIKTVIDKERNENESQ